MQHVVGFVRFIVLCAGLAVAGLGCGQAGTGSLVGAGGNSGNASSGAGGFLLADSGLGVDDSGVGTDGRIVVVVIGGSDGGGHKDAAPPDKRETGAFDVVESAVVAPATCEAIPLDAPPAEVTNVNTGKVIDDVGFTGGVIASGVYWLTTITHFGGTYAGLTREIWVIDAAGRTLEDAFLPSGTKPKYAGYTLESTSQAVLKAKPSCGAATTPRTWRYLANGSMSGATLSVHPEGTHDVLVFTKQ